MLFIPGACISPAENRLYTASFPAFQDGKKEKPSLSKYNYSGGFIMECTMISFKWKTGQIQTTIESIIDYSVSPAELKKLLNMATENRDEVKASFPNT